MSDENKLSDSEQIAAMLSRATGGDARPNWFPVGLTLDEWKAREAPGADEWVVDQGAVLHAADGSVYMIGMIGSCRIGRIRPDGTIDRRFADLHAQLPYEEAVIVEAADPPGSEKDYSRERPAGKLVFTKEYLAELEEEYPRGW